MSAGPKDPTSRDPVSVDSVDEGFDDDSLESLPLFPELDEPSSVTPVEIPGPAQPATQPRSPQPPAAALPPPEVTASGPAAPEPAASEPLASPSPGPQLPAASTPLYSWAAASPSRRLAAGLADLLVQGGVAILVLLGQASLGVLPRQEHAPALLLFLLAFSFLYTVVPMAFWGQTPGMSAAAVAAVAADGENPSFPQCALRWLGAVASTALLGLPLLLALGSGGSLGDRLSHTATVATEAPGEG